MKESVTGARFLFQPNWLPPQQENICKNISNNSVNHKLFGKKKIKTHFIKQRSELIYSSIYLLNKYLLNHCCKGNHYCKVIGPWETIEKVLCVHVKSLQSCLTLCNPLDCNPLGSSVRGIFQARILEWVAIPSSRDLPNPGIKPASLMFPALAGGFFTTSATWEAQNRWHFSSNGY